MPHKSLLAALGLLVAVVLVAVVAAPIAATANDSALARILKAGVVKVAVPENFPPFGTLGPDAKPQGYDIDTAALIAEALGVKLELVPVSSAKRIPYLTSGKVDLIVASLGKDPEREKLIDFSIAYAPFFSGIFGPKHLEIAKPEDLAGKTIAVTRDTVEDAALTKLAPQTATIKRYKDNDRTGAAFLANQTELIATGNVVAAAILAGNPPKKPTIKFLIRNSPCHVGIGKGEPDLLARIDAIIAAALRDGSLDRISQHWLKVPLAKDLEQPSWVSVN